MAFRAKIQSFISDAILFGIATSDRVRLKNNSGILEARNNADSSFIIGRGSDPVGDDDWTTKRYVDNLVVKGTAIVDFGANPFQAEGEGNVVSVTIPAAWVLAGDVILVSPQAVATADHDPDDYAVEGITAYAANIVPGVSFDIIAQATESSWGTYQVSYARV